VDISRETLIQSSWRISVGTVKTEYTEQSLYVLKTVILFVVEYGSAPWEDEGRKALRLACRNTEMLRGRKVELEHFLNQYCVYICFLSETFLNPGQAVQLAHYVCHHIDRLIAGCAKAILVRRGTVHQSVSVPGLTHLEATAIQVILAGKPVKTLAANFCLPAL
jgi:hypothetical protein